MKEWRVLCRYDGINVFRDYVENESLSLGLIG